MLVVCLQMRLMETAGDAQMLGAALNHSALNVANALGAWLGGLVIAAGLGYRAPSAVGAGLAVAGLSRWRSPPCCAAVRGRRRFRPPAHPGAASPSAEPPPATTLQRCRPARRAGAPGR